MNLLDIDTLQLCSLVNTSAFGIVFLLLWRGRKADDYLLFWSASALLYGGVMIGFALWGERGMGAATALLMMLAFSNTVSVMGVRRFEGRPVLAPWMALPALVIGVAHLGPLLLMAQGWLPTDSQIPRIADVLGLTAAMAINGTAMISGPLRGQRIAGAGLLAYIPIFLISLVGHLGVLSGDHSLGSLPLLADQALLGIINLGLLVLPIDQAQDALHAAALRDPLTGVWNRAGLEVQKRRLLAPGAAVVAIDVDHFKAVNDLHGHEAGDAVLRGIAQEAGRIAQAQDGALARIGGDEFILLLPASCEGQRLIVEALMNRCRAAGAAPGSWSVSIGFSQVTAAETGFEPAVVRADKALYHAKAEGRDRVAGLAA
ncbi:diguanylate cyclase (GGDEF)-like protein [Sphingobium sp. B11D3B]|uniref:GGDEF domain-containing protein n=1 Tax=Sphingobium sp. B11D3B TaxID=2940575 RepID=UPI002227AA30|nr:GGDEF domain-containing protein [Sphingobium sp. B11D3B]MCW2388775.1 diguanylate cyclase (GGDEF)-like protein [Sphingobium sp. B11D3B]